MEVNKLKQKLFELAISGKFSNHNLNENSQTLLLEIDKEKEQLFKNGLGKKPKKRKEIVCNDDGKYYEIDGEKALDVNDKILFKLPANWSYCRLGDFVKTVTDYVASGSFKSLNENVKYYNEENYAVLVRTCDFKNNFNESLVYTDKHGYEFLNNSNLFGGELILSNIGASIGKVFIVPNLDKKMTLAPNSIMVKFFNEESRDYFYYFFLSPFGQKLLFSISSSSAQAKFNKTDFKDLIIPIPPLSEQVQISSQIKEIENILIDIDSSKERIDALVGKAKIKMLENIFFGKTLFKNYYEQDFVLNDLLSYEQPGPFIVENTDYNDSYETPVLTPGKSFILGYTNEKTGIYSPKSKVIIFDDFTTASRLIDFKFKVKSSAMKILSSTDESKFNIDYLYYLLQTIHINSDTHKRFWISSYAPTKVKIHKFDEQKKIVDKINAAFALFDSIVK